MRIQARNLYIIEIIKSFNPIALWKSWSSQLMQRLRTWKSKLFNKRYLKSWMVYLLIKSPSDFLGYVTNNWADQVTTILKLPFFLNRNSTEHKYLRVRYQDKKPPNLVKDKEENLEINMTKNLSSYKKKMERKILNIRCTKKPSTYAKKRRRKI